MLLLLFNQAAASQTLTPSLVANGSSFYAATVTAGAVTLQPGLLSDVDNFRGAAIRATYALAPATYTSAAAFYDASVSASIALLPALFDDPDAFFDAATSGGTSLLQPHLVGSQNGFFSPSVNLRSQPQTAFSGMVPPRYRRPRQEPLPLQTIVGAASATQSRSSVSARGTVQIESAASAAGSRSRALFEGEINLQASGGIVHRKAAAGSNGSQSLRSRMTASGLASSVLSVGLVHLAGTGSSSMEPPIVPEYVGDETRDRIPQEMEWAA